jgi:2-oxo-4-hydroxy-4-carboxy--5-ureidoimidazoline (OHCU) decarboxylase
MRSANEELADFNRYSSEQHAALASRFAGHVETLGTVHASLLAVFRRTRRLRQRLLDAHPELQPAVDAADAAREAEIEQARPRPRERDEG